jgi:ankyrin repeat protein
MQFQTIIFVLLSICIDAATSNLQVALQRRSYHRVEELLRSGHNPNTVDEDGISPLTVAITSRDVATVYAFLDAGASIAYLETTDQFPLFVALDSWNREIFGALLRRGARVDITDADGFTVLDVAVQHRNHAAQRMLRDLSHPN